MIANPEWLKTEKKPYVHHISLVCISQLVDCLKSLGEGKIDIDTAIKMEAEILSDEIDDPGFYNFAIENFSELFSYIATDRVSIRIHRDITGKMWFGVG
ncbi:MAG: hypothetical protein ACYSR0_12720 [Planctomycetota bacterium]|jgi:hypothetical protein